MYGTLREARCIRTSSGARQLDRRGAGRGTGAKAHQVTGMACQLAGGPLKAPCAAAATFTWSRCRIPPRRHRASPRPPGCHLLSAS